MKLSILTVSVVCVLMVTNAHALTIFSLETTGGLSAATLYDGDTLDFFVTMVSDTDVLAVQYDVVLPTANWQLLSRDYGSYGWVADASFFDQASPRQSAAGYPYTIDANLYADGAAGAADFHQATGRADSNALVAGTYTIEKWVLGVPSGTPDDTYYLTLTNPLITDGEFSEFSGGSGEDFALTVRNQTNDIPEPGTLSLVLLGIVGLGVVARRRRS